MALAVSIPVRGKDSKSFWRGWQRAAWLYGFHPREGKRFQKDFFMQRLAALAIVSIPVRGKDSKSRC